MDIIKELAVMIYKLEHISYDESKSDPEYKKMTPKQFERNVAERIKTLNQQLNQLKKQ